MLITYREVALMVEDDVASAATKQRVAIVIAHEACPSVVRQPHHYAVVEQPVVKRGFRLLHGALRHRRTVP